MFSPKIVLLFGHNIQDRCHFSFISWQDLLSCPKDLLMYVIGCPSYIRTASIPTPKASISIIKNLVKSCKAKLEVQLWFFLSIWNPADSSFQINTSFFNGWVRALLID